MKFAFTVPFFNVAINMVSGTNLFATMPKRMAMDYAQKSRAENHEGAETSGRLLVLDGLASTNE